LRIDVLGLDTELTTGAALPLLSMSIVSGATSLLLARRGYRAVRITSGLAVAGLLWAWALDADRGDQDCDGDQPPIAISTPIGRELLATANVLISGSGQIINYHADRLGPLVETQPVANPARR
jgi:hypothetical protein